MAEAVVGCSGLHTRYLNSGYPVATQGGVMVCFVWREYNSALPSVSKEASTMADYRLIMFLLFIRAEVIEKLFSRGQLSS